MEKLKLETPDLTQQNIDRIAELFPSAITETKDEDGKLKRAINFTVLKQLLSGEVVDGEECYEFTWVGKKQSIIEGNRPIRKTLRPAKEESKNWDTTENLYIEGDNLEVLKLLQNSYLNSIKMIYIDPPYNTGNDFVYRDDFKVSREEYEDGMGVYDEDDNKLFKNTETNGRFHSDWCSMMYPRLQLARNLLSDDGVIFISIDDNEVHNLRKICDEVFGESNLIGPIIQNKQNSKNDTVNVQRNHEYILIYRKREEKITGAKVKPSLINKSWVEKTIIQEGGRFYYLNDSITTRGEGGVLNKRPNLGYTVYYNPDTLEFLPDDDYDKELAKTSNDLNAVYFGNEELLSRGFIAIRPPEVRGKLGCWTWSIDKFKEEIESLVVTGKNDSFTIKKRTFVNPELITQISNRLVYKYYSEGNSRSILDFSTNDGTSIFNDIMGFQGLFDNPKNINMLEYFIKLLSSIDFTILDFFSGSSTTAHAVMQLNAEDGGNRKFIMVQLPEETDEKSEAYKAGYKNICEIGKERIRRAGKKIEEEFEAKSNKGDLFDDEKKVKTVDTGFRVLKVDDTNMKDVYYSAGEYSQQMLLNLESNIKEDRNDMDLLYGVLLDWGVPLSLPHATETIEGKRVHFVNEDNLVACFEDNVSEAVVREIAKRKPERVVFRDSSFSSSPEKINVTEIFKTLSPDTSVKVV